MALSADDRGVAPVVGAVLIFGLLILSFSLYQAHVVPDENRRVEIAHSGDVQADLVALRNALLDGSPGEQSVSVSLGPRYPVRRIALNPPAPSGHLETVAWNDSIRIENATVVGHANTEAYWSQRSFTFTGTTLVYRPGYFEYRNGPNTSLEHSYAYNRFADGPLALAPQRIVDGNRIVVLELGGNVSLQGTGAETVEVHRRSASATTIAIEPAGSDPITLTLPTGLAPGEVGVVIDPAAHDAVDDAWVDADGRLRVQLANDRFALQLHSVRVGSPGGDVQPAYLVPVGGTSVLVGQHFTAEVRDPYNNPVAGVNLSVAGCDGALDPATLTTDAQGRVSPTCYTADDVTLSIGADSYERQTFSVISNGGRDPLPAATPTFERLDATIDEGPGNNPDSVILDFEISETVDEVVFTVANDEGQNSVTEPTTDAGQVTVDIPRGTSEYPVTVTADIRDPDTEITDGECLEATLDGPDDAASLTYDEWASC